LIRRRLGSGWALVQAGANRRSWLGLGWHADHRLSGLSSHFPEVFPPVRLGLRPLAAVRLDDLQGEVLELAEQGADILRVVEQGLVLGELAGGPGPCQNLSRV